MNGWECFLRLVIITELLIKNVGDFLTVMADDMI